MNNNSGYALIGQDLHNASHPSYRVPLSISLANTHAATLLSLLHDQHQMNVSGMMAWGDGDDFPLRWGEIIPLWFFMTQHHQHQQQQQPRHKHGGTEQLMRTLIMSQPSRRSTEGSTSAMLTELHDMGALTMKYLDGLLERVMIVISSDLAHTHSADGPYGYSPAAQPFDDAITRWAQTMDDTWLIKQAAPLLDDAKSCGFTGNYYTRTPLMMLLLLLRTM
jgi:aromatic ring-opening dioxygenase LigB subunit